MNVPEERKERIRQKLLLYYKNHLNTIKINAGKKFAKKIICVFQL